MSIHLMNQAWRTSLATGPKFVLVAICDTANDDGVCWPSVSTICDRCSMHERTVQRHLEDLEKIGIVTRAYRRGRSTNYTVHESKFPFSTPVKKSPPAQSHPRQKVAPGDLSSTPVHSDTPPPAICTETPGAMPPRTTSNHKENHQGISGARGTRLPTDWILSKALGTWALTEQPTWTAEHVRKIADAFRDYWIAQPGQKGRKSDWEATWRNWVRNEKAVGGSSVAGEAVSGNWWEGDAGINAKGIELDVARQKDESTPQYLVRVAKLAGRGPWIDHILKSAQKVNSGWYQQVVSYLGEALMPTDFYAS